MDIFGTAPASATLVTGGFAASYVMGLSGMNMAGRMGWGGKQQKHQHTMDPLHERYRLGGGDCPSALFLVDVPLDFPSMFECLVDFPLGSHWGSLPTDEQHLIPVSPCAASHSHLMMLAGVSDYLGRKQTYMLFGCFAPIAVAMPTMTTMAAK